MKIDYKQQYELVCALTLNKHPEPARMSAQRRSELIADAHAVINANPGDRNIKGRYTTPMGTIRAYAYILSDDRKIHHTWFTAKRDAFNRSVSTAPIYEEPLDALYAQRNASARHAAERLNLMDQEIAAAEAKVRAALVTTTAPDTEKNNAGAS